MTNFKEWTFATITGGVSFATTNEILQTVFLSASILGLIINIVRKNKPNEKK